MNNFNIKNKVKLVKENEMKWDWDGSFPSFVTKTPNSKYGGIYSKFDPFPCYHHNVDLVKSELKRISEIFPIKFDVYYFIFQYECYSRTNGQAYTNPVNYKTEKQKATWDGVVDLYGKRIPPHPAMTRYLVSHEMGHIIDSYICNMKGLEENGLDKDYTKLRNIKYNPKYGGKKWHTNVGEIIANDIRICLFDSEINFWPHDCVHPLDNKKVVDFWEEMKKEYKNE